MATNIDELMRQVLSMVKEKEDERTSPYRRMMRAQANAMYPDIDHTQNLELLGAKNKGLLDAAREKSTGDLAVQESHNTGGLAVQKENTVGQMARQRLINTGKIDEETLRNEGNLATKNIEAGYHRDVANIGLKGHETAAGATIEASRNKLMGDYERAQGERDKATITTSGKSDVEQIKLGMGGKGLPAPVVDTGAQDRAFEGARSLARQRMPLPPQKSRTELITPIPMPAAPPVGASSAFLKPDATPAAPVVAPRPVVSAPDPLADRLAAQREEERKRGKKRLTDLIPRFGNRQDKAMGY